MVFTAKSNLQTMQSPALSAGTTCMRKTSQNVFAPRATAKVKPPANPKNIFFMLRVARDNHLFVGSAISYGPLASYMDPSRHLGPSTVRGST